MKVPTQHHAKWNLRLKDPQQSRGGSEWLQDVQSYLASENFGEQGNLMEPGWLSPQHGLWGNTDTHRYTQTHTHTTPAKFSLHVCKVKPGVSVSLLI